MTETIEELFAAVLKRLNRECLERFSVQQEVLLGRLRTL